MTFQSGDIGPYLDAFPSLRERPHTLPHLLEWRATETPGAVALTGADGKLTFSVWARRAQSVASELTRRGVGRGDAIGLFAGNGVATGWASALLGIQWCGAIPVLVNNRLSPGAVEAALRRVGARHCISDSAVVSGDHDDPLKVISLEEVMGDSAAAEFGEPLSQPADPAAILRTSGTTGPPKAPVLSHQTLVAIGAITEDHVFGAPNLGGVGLGPHDTVQTSIPLDTTSGLMHAITVALYSGLRVVCEPRFDPQTTLDTMRREKTTIWLTVPAMMTLLTDGLADPVTDTQLRVVWHMGSIAPPELVRRTVELFPGASCVNLYSLTESGAAMVNTSAEDGRLYPGTAGRPTPVTEVRIINERGETAAPREVGRVFMSSPLMLMGYREGDAIVEGQLEEWLETGDLGYHDESGLLWLIGRSGDVIIRGGFNIHPTTVEKALSEHPEVLEAAVAPIQHRVLGQDVVAVVVLREPVEDDALREHCMARVADYEVPRTYVSVDELPRNEFGKLDRQRVRQMIEQRLAVVD